MSHTRSRCPSCNTVIGGSDWRDGVRLPATQLRIYDAVKSSGDTGVSSQALQDRLNMGPNNLKAQIWNLNENLALIDRRVWAGVARGNYRLVEWPTPPRLLRGRYLGGLVVGVKRRDPPALFSPLTRRLDV